MVAGPLTTRGEVAQPLLGGGCVPGVCQRARELLDQLHELRGVPRPRGRQGAARTAHLLRRAPRPAAASPRELLHPSVCALGLTGREEGAHGLQQALVAGPEALLEAVPQVLVRARKVTSLAGALDHDGVALAVHRQLAQLRVQRPLRRLGKPLFGLGQVAAAAAGAEQCVERARLGLRAPRAVELGHVALSLAHIALPAGGAHDAVKEVCVLAPSLLQQLGDSRPLAEP
mmetsp:Transcript_108861/g.307839  ORF Transcript_108861/g.307839 Transcript_108861/m.307839 type:complete len:230 (+) Transcript_108861:335-1024(+)